MKIAPSILAADLSDLKAGLAVCREGAADLVHVDVMDGHFVPNLTFGPPVVEAVARSTDIPLDIHLMVSDPDSLLDRYLELRPQWISFHWEAGGHVDRTVGRIRDGGVGAGVALNPATPVELLIDILPSLDFVLLMSVNPGFAGQAFIPYVLEKARRMRKLISERGLSTQVELDGGVKTANVDEVCAAGIDVAVVGSGIFAQPDPVATLESLRSRATA